MSTNFDTSFVNGDVIEAQHVKQFSEPIQELESGAALFRVATNDSGAYQVDFTTSANPNGHSINSLSQGQVIVFKASHNSPASATLKLLRNDAPGFETHPLFLGDAQAESDDILENQMVIVVFNATTTPRFDVVGISSGAGSGGAGSLEDLDGVSLSTPVAGQVLQYDGTEFGNATLGTSDVSGLDAALTGKANTSHTHAATDITSGTLPIARGGTGGTTAATARTALGTNNAANITSGTLPLTRGGTGGTSAALARTSLDVPSNSDLTSGLAGKQSTSEKGQVNGYAGLDGSGKVPTSQLPAASGGGASELSDLSDVIISSPASGDVLRYNGTEFVNSELSAADVSAQPQDAALDEISTLSMAKGDIFVHDGSEVASLAKPTADGKFLTTDSNEPTGLKWIDSEGRRPGDLILAYKAPLSGFLRADGSIVSQSAYPELFAAVGLKSVPSDGTSWNKITGPNTTDEIRSITYGNSTFVAVGEYGAIWTSSDGTNWVKRTGPNTTDALYGITYGNEMFVTVGLFGAVWTSSDGTSWTKRTGPNITDNLFSVTCGNGMIVVIGDTVIWTSSDGTNWVKHTGPNTTDALYGITYGNGMFVAVGEAGAIWISADGASWTKRTGPNTNDNLFSVTCGKEMFVAVGVDGVIWTSSDGTSWTKRTGPNTNDGLYGITYGNGMFVAIGYPNVIWTSLPSYLYNPSTEFMLPDVPDLGEAKAWIKT